MSRKNDCKELQLEENWTEYERKNMQRTSWTVEKEMTTERQHGSYLPCLFCLTAAETAHMQLYVEFTETWDKFKQIINSAPKSLEIVIYFYKTASTMQKLKWWH